MTQADLEDLDAMTMEALRDWRIEQLRNEAYAQWLDEHEEAA